MAAHRRLEHSTGLGSTSGSHLAPVRQLGQTERIWGQACRATSQVCGPDGKLAADAQQVRHELGEVTPAAAAARVAPSCTLLGETNPVLTSPAAVGRSICCTTTRGFIYGVRQPRKDRWSEACRLLCRPGCGAGWRRGIRGLSSVGG
jgi:hypothetical protein